MAAMLLKTLMDLPSGNAGMAVGEPRYRLAGGRIQGTGIIAIILIFRKKAGERA